jgi:hypothetical protein
MTLDKDDKEHIDMRVEHFLSKALPEALAEHIILCPVAARVTVVKWTIIGVMIGIGIAGGNAGFREVLRLFGVCI